MAALTRVKNYILLIVIFCMLLTGVSDASAGESDNTGDSQRMRFKYAFDVGGQPAVTMIQDRDGFIWTGSFFQGAVRFDGYETKNYSEGTRSLSNSFAAQIFEDKDGFIWIGTSDGLNRYDKETDTFEVYKHDSGNPSSLPNNAFNISSPTILEDSDGFLWFGTQRGLGRFDRKTETFTNYFHDPGNPKTLSGNNIYSIIEDRDGFLWIAAKNRGLSRLDRKTGIATRYRHDPDNRAATLPDDIYCIAEGPDGHLWLGTKEHGLFKFDKHSKFTQYTHNPGDTRSLPKIWIWSMSFLKSGKFILTETNGDAGLVLFDPQSGESEVYKHNPNDPYSLLSNRTAGALEDRNGILWIVLNSGEVQVYDPRGIRFKLYTNDPSNPESLASNAPIPIFEDSGGTVWIGHFGAGLDRYDPETDTFTNFQHDPKDDRTILHGYPSGFFEDEKGNFHVSTARGMSLFDRDKGCVARHLTRDTWFYAIKEDRHNPDILWANGWQQGLCAYNKKTGTVRRFLHDPENPGSLSNDTALKFIIDKDDSGILWIPTWGGGLERFEIGTEKFTHFRSDSENPESISSNTVYDAYEDSRGNFWVATASGLSKFDKRKGTFRRYSEEDGFTAMIVHFILEDDNGFLWMGTDIGLVQFETETETVRKIYTREDGLHSHDFFNSSSLKTKDGQIWIGGFKGLNVFHPSDLKDNGILPPVYLTSIKQYGKKLQTGKALERLKALVFDWHRNSFEFEFAALNYTNPSQNQYAYKLEGLEDDWLYTGKRRFGRYTSIPPGKYTLRIKGSNNDGIWNEEGASVRITVTSPPWKRPWAYALYILAAGSLVFVFMRHQKNKLEHQQKIAEQERRTAESLRRMDQLKDEFLANTSHELRTPLSGIVGIADSLIDGSVGPLTEEQRHNLSLIVSSGRRLTNLVNDILDFSKLRKRDIQLRLKPLDMRSVADVVLRLSQTLLGNREIQLVNEIGADLPAAHADENRVQQILHNLVGNAVKFTETGTISVSARVQDKYLAIAVSDTGIGIPEDRLDRIFESFEQADGSTEREYGGTGLGLAVTKNLVELHGGQIRADSEPGKGSHFTFTLPVSGDKAEATQAADILAGDTRVAGISAEPAEIGQTGEPDVADIPPEHLCEGAMCRILAVDDEPVNLQVLKNQLGSEHYSVTLAADGMEAIAALESGQEFDLVLLDVMMPGMSGYEVCQRLREKHPENELPVVMLTAKNQIGDLVAGFDSGASDYLTKPFSKQELIARIGIHISLKYLYESQMRAETEAKLLSREMELARNIQTCLLPASLEEIHPDFEIAATMVPADEVGGDFYEVVLDNSGQLWVSIGDVSGHGVTPGLIMMMAQTVHTTVTTSPGYDARNAVVKINEILYKNVSERLGEKHFMSFNALRHLGDGKFEHAGAHLRIIVHRRESGQCELIRTRGIYLNFRRDISKPTKNSYFELGEGGCHGSLHRRPDRVGQPGR